LGRSAKQTNNVLLCVIYQLNFAVFMFVTRISRYIQRSVFCAVSRNRGRSWTVLPVNTGALLYTYSDTELGQLSPIHTYHAVPMPFPCHADPLRVYIVSFQFDFHSAAVFDSHMPCRSHAVPMPYHEYAVLKATFQGHATGTAWERHGMCELASAVQRRHVGDLPAFGIVGEWQGRGRFVAGSRQGTGMGTAWFV
jgi:hypothetical protein